MATVTEDIAQPSVTRRLSEQVAGIGGRVLTLGGAGDPDVLVLHPEVGLVVIDVIEDAGHPTNPAHFVRLNEKAHGLRQLLDLDPTEPVARVVLDPALQIDEPIVGVGSRTTIGPRQISSPSWFDVLPPNPLDHETSAKVVAALMPQLTFTSSFRSSSSDLGAEDRAAIRVTLDQQQSVVAQRDDVDVALLQGPPGSGKTLVLAARARWLAARHPGWRIRLLCYNRALLPYLESLTYGHANITVSLFTGFAQQLGVRFSFSDDEVSFRALATAKGQGIRKIAEAILIDEVQDFRPPWLELAYEALVPNKGGLLMAGDTAQALYHSEQIPDRPWSKRLELVKLDRPYRSTRSILDAVGALDGGFEVPSAATAPVGEPVELIWAESWDQQAECVAWEIDLMLSSGDRRPRDIGILVTTKYGTFGRLGPALSKFDIPFSIIDRRNASEFDRSEDTVKLMTVHSAKGHEFPVVFIFGLETLPKVDHDDEESVRRGRVGFVGATRAMDQLLITYTRDNDFLRMLSKDEANVRRWVWPDSYEGAVNG